MKQLLTIVMLGILFTGCRDENRSTKPVEDSQIKEASDKVERDRDSAMIEVDPISHATAVITWGDAVFYLDPTGGAGAFEGKNDPDLVLITDIHGDHMNAETLQELDLKNIQIIVPQAVKDELPQEMHQQLVVLKNGENQEIKGFNIEAVPMYNLPETDESRHVKGRGNGYVIEKNGRRLYIAGDTEDIPEMRDLEDINIALVPMNLPYTMTVEQAAEGVLAFQPDQVYPYHYRGQDGFADVDKFKELVQKENKDIEVILLEWYPGNAD